MVNSVPVITFGDVIQHGGYTETPAIAGESTRKLFQRFQILNRL
jgi:hypothetical protein